MHSQASFLPFFNGLNFSDWSEQVQFHLDVLNLNLALRTEKLANLIDKRTNEQSKFYKVWERSNKLCLIFIRMIIANNIKSALPKIENVKELMKFVEGRSQ